MEENEELEQNVQNEEVGITTVKGINEMSQKKGAKCDIFTNITDKKKLFNLDSHIDVLLNDCEGEIIHVKEILVKRYEKNMKKPILDEETGEIIKDTEITMSTILVDDKDKSYATGSKIFAIQLSKYVEMFGLNDEGFTIKIVKQKRGENNNKALGFEIV